MMHSERRSGNNPTELERHGRTCPRLVPAIHVFLLIDWTQADFCEFAKSALQLRKFG
jgi:hypothetical protein